MTIYNIWNQIYEDDNKWKHQFETCDNKTWTPINSKQDVPYQLHTANCGVYLCLYADVWTLSISSFRGCE